MAIATAQYATGGLFDGKDMTRFTKGERRRSDRFEDRQAAAIVTSRRRQICDVLDLSQNGAKLRIVEGLTPVPEESVTLTLLDGTSLPSVVTWAKGQMIGLQFLRSLAVVEAHLILEELGGDYFRRAVQLQKRISPKT